MQDLPSWTMNCQVMLCRAYNYDKLRINLPLPLTQIEMESGKEFNFSG